MTFKNLIRERVEPGIEILKINRPAALNALNTETLTELREVLREISLDQSIRVLVITGEGEKSFIAGADIAEMANMNPEEGTEFSQLGHEVAFLLEQMSKPTIAAVNGFALGGGTEIAIACDFILASDNAVFGQPEVSLGIVPGFGGTFRLARFVGVAMAKELIFTGRRIKAVEALELGLVNHVYSQAEFREKVIELATQISKQSVTAVTKAKMLISEFLEVVGIHAKRDAEAQTFGYIFGTHDQIEGMRAFVEKRKPSFEGL